MSSNIEVRLREREQARKAVLEQQRLEKEGSRRKEETVGYFTQQFTAKKTKIEELLQLADTLPVEQLSSHFDNISSECQAFQKYVSNSAIFLTSFDLRSSQQQINQLMQDISAKQDQLLPKKKFAFKSRKKASAQPQGEETQPKTKEKKSITSLSESFVGFRERERQKLSMNEDEVKGHDINLSQLSGCEVRLYGNPSTLHMSKLSNCLILCGPVSSSVFVEDCRDCTYVVACQQLRVHSTHHSKFYLHVSSRAIIEDTSDVQFAPYSWNYPIIDRHFEAAGLKREENNWDKVDDFNWLASKDPSPNWNILPECDRTKEWTCK